MVDDGKIRRSCKSADDPQTVIETFVNKQGIDRDKEIYSLVRFLNSIDGHYVIALDGGWGCGKSFFVQHTMLFHEVLSGDEEAFRKKYNKVSEKIEVEDNGKKEEKDTWEAVVKRCDQIKGEKKDNGEKEGEKREDGDIYLYYDAWKNDAFGDDPLVSILYNTLPEERKEKFCILKNALKAFGETRVSIGLGGVGNVSLPKPGDLWSIFKKRVKEEYDAAIQYKRLHKFVEKVLTDSLGKKSRFIIFIDELDRCNPLFAVKVLERVKHCFDNPKLVFVFSVNLEQLQHTIRNVYGQEFDAMTYLHRFFDKQISLQRPGIDALVRGKLENRASGEFCKVARYAIDCYKFHIREILQFLDELDDVCGAISYLIKTQNLKNDIVFKEDPKDDVGTVYNAETNAYFFAFDIIIPLLIGLRIKNRNVYDAVLNDKDVNTDVSEYIWRYFRENGNGLWSRALKSWTPEQMSGRPLTKQDLDRIYSAMFPLWNHDALATVGQLDFSKRVRERVKELLSGLAKQRQEKKSWDSSYQKYWNTLTGISVRESDELDGMPPEMKKKSKEYFEARKLIYRTEPYKKTGNILIISLSEAVQMEFVWCPAGTFTMGSPDGKSEYPIDSGEKPEKELERADNETQYKVTLSKGFWIGRYPITQIQYKAITRKNPSRFKGDNNPVEQVNWYDSVVYFCKRLNQLKIAPEGYKFVLPTEAQWEYACRAGTTTALNNGKLLTLVDGEYPNLGEVGWYGENSGYKTHPVGEKRPNAWGIYDMHGNVYEWCADRYGAYPRGTVTDPTGPETGEDRVLRGGSWHTYAKNCRSAHRKGYDPGSRSARNGFRLALVPEQKTASTRNRWGWYDARRVLFTSCRRTRWGGSICRGAFCCRSAGS